MTCAATCRRRIYRLAVLDYYRKFRFMIDAKFSPASACSVAFSELKAYIENPFVVRLRQFISSGCEKRPRSLTGGPSDRPDELFGNKFHSAISHPLAVPRVTNCSTGRTAQVEQY